MAECIEREALLHDIEQSVIYTARGKITSAEMRGAHKIIERIKCAPAADVAPVAHGRWIHTDLASHWYGKDECSECTYHEQDRSDLSHFRCCPNCGARMDGGVNDEKLDAAPTVDAVEVVRCKDCEYSYDEISYLCCSHGVCVDCEVPPDFYCAEGKRKEPD